MFQIGQQIGIYTLIRKIGQGGFGEVWLAEKSSEGFRTFTKKVAVKLPHPEQVDISAMEKEALLWEQASGHPNVLPIIDADVFDGQVVIVSEFADGGSLADKLVIDGKLPVKTAVELAIGILNGLQYLHTKGIIHRDIKPQNILLQGNTPRLADFGISRAMNTTNFSTAIVGTDAYMSPEALDGNRSKQTDIWSVGVVLYQMLQGELPFSQVHRSERMFAILSKEYTPLTADIPQRLHQIIAKSLAKKPAERFSSANEMIENLNNFTAEFSRITYLPTEKILPIIHKTINTDESVSLPQTQFFNQFDLNKTNSGQTTKDELLVTKTGVNPTAESLIDFSSSSELKSDTEFRIKSPVQKSVPNSAGKNITLKLKLIALFFLILLLPFSFYFVITKWFFFKELEKNPETENISNTPLILSDVNSNANVLNEKLSEPLIVESNANSSVKLENSTEPVILQKSAAKKDKRGDKIPVHLENKLKNARNAIKNIPTKNIPTNTTNDDESGVEVTRPEPIKKSKTPNFTDQLNEINKRVKISRPRGSGTLPSQ